MKKAEYRIVKDGVYKSYIVVSKETKHIIYGRMTLGRQPIDIDCEKFWIKRMHRWEPFDYDRWLYAAPPQSVYESEILDPQNVKENFIKSQKDPREVSE